jgi:hypothetical protein
MKTLAPPRNNFLKIYPVGYLLIGNPAIRKENWLKINKPLSHFDHLAIRLKITILSCPSTPSIF